MDTLIKDMSLLNSTYSKEKINSTFDKILSKYGVNNYILISKLTQLCSDVVLEYDKEIQLKCGNYNVIFRYSSKEKCLAEEGLKILIASYIIAIENSNIYNDLFNRISFGENKDYPTFKTLILDIHDAIENYKRYDTPFSVGKINLNGCIYGEKNVALLLKYAEKIKNVVRANDKVYIDGTSIYVLFVNLTETDYAKVVNNLHSNIPNCYIGIAEWKGDYVIPDLFGEIDNFIYYNYLNKKNSESKQTKELSKILDKAILLNHTIVITTTSSLNDSHKSYKVLEFELDGCNYSVLKKYPSPSDFEKAYVFNFEDIVDDVYSYLRKNRD